MAKQPAASLGCPLYLHPKCQPALVMKGLLQVGPVNQEACLHSQGTHSKGKEAPRRDSGTVLSPEPHTLLLSPWGQAWLSGRSLAFCPGGCQPLDQEPQASLCRSSCKGPSFPVARLGASCSRLQAVGGGPQVLTLTCLFQVHTEAQPCVAL